MLTTRAPRQLLVALLTVLLMFGALPAAAQPSREDPVPPRFAAGEVLIGWAPGRGPVGAVRPARDALQPDTAAADWQTATRQLAAETGLPVLHARPDYGTARLKVRAGREWEEIARLSALPWVRYAEPNYLAYAAGADSVGGEAVYPNDPDFDLQWNMHRVNAPEAWATGLGSLSFVVAVLDTGVAGSHPEFAGKLLGGKNYITPNQPPEDDDPESHGTHVTGIIAARFNNSQGVAGLAPDVKVLPLKVLDANRSGSFGPISEAIRDAANNQAQVINMSLVGYDYNIALHEAVNYAISRGALVVAAGGNCAQGGAACRGQINPTVYPAAFPGVLAVAASDRFDRPATYSGYKSYIGIAAPGGTTERGVWSSIRFGYGYMHGTSMSAPLVSAAAALVWTLRPASSAEQIVQALRSSADKTGTDPYSGEPLPYGAGRNDYFGAGRLNAANAVRQVYPPALAGPGWQNLLAGGTQRVLERKVTVTNPSGQGVWWQATVLEGASWLTVSPANGTAVFGAPAELILAADTRTLAPGSYFGRVQLTALAPAGIAPVDIPVQLTVAADLTRVFAPLAGRDFARAWYDPDAADNLYRFEPNVTSDGLAQVVLPFPVSFYGAAFPAITISENGFVLFGQGNAAAQAPSTCPGNGAAPNNALYALAADWVVDAGAGVIVHYPTADTFAVTWRNARLSGSDARGTFQLVITRGGEFRVNYRDLEDAAGAVIGSENDDGTASETITCQGRGSTPPATGTLSFNPRAPWQ